jgi:hypothetical protein
MKFGKIKIVVTYALLLYFLCFIVPPVSSILPSVELSADTDDITAIGKDTTRERMYLFDLTLWEILKRAKRSDKVTALLPRGSEDHSRSADRHYRKRSGHASAADRALLSCPE